MKRLIIIGIALILSACAGLLGGRSGSSTTGATSYIITRPESGNLIIVGVSGRQSRPEYEINNAKENAARKASMYHSVSVTFEEVHDIGVGYLDYYVGSSTKVDYDQQLGTYMERLSYDPEKDVTRNDDGSVFIRFTYSAASPANFNYTLGKNPDGSPEWTSRRPNRLNGYIAGVGRSGRLDSISETFIKSCEAAAASIVATISTDIGSGDSVTQNQAGSQIYRQSSGTLRNFLVLETWIDPNSRAVYTLAVAQAAN